MTGAVELPVDEAAFRALQQSAGPAFVVDLVDTFLDEAPRMLDQLAAAQQAGAVDAFRRTAHSLKSNSLTFGANTLAAMARELELAAAASVKDGTSLTALTHEYARVAAALVKLRDDV